MIPHERSLVERFNNKPFALLGVNNDKDPEKLKRDLLTNQVTWRSFKNQRSGGPSVSSRWQVTGYPTLFLIDHKGVIRKKWVGRPPDAELDKQIEQLVAEAEGDKKN